MKLIINGASRETGPGTSIAAFLAGEGLEPSAVVVELNQRIVPAPDYAATLLHDDDQLEILSFVGGG